MVSWGGRFDVSMCQAGAIAVSEDPTGAAAGRCCEVLLRGKIHPQIYQVSMVLYIK